MKNKIILGASLTFLILIHSLTLFGQNVHQIKADELFDRYAYKEAIDEYQKVIEKNPDNLTAKIRIAECYRLTGGTDKAEYWYLQVVNAKDSKPIYKLYYAQALMSNNNYDLAKVILNEYKTANPSDDRADFALKTIENLSYYFKDTASYKISKLSINSANGDFSPVIYKDGLLFTSSRETKDLTQRKHEWTGQPFLNLYYAKGKANSFSGVESFATNVQIKYNDGPVCFNKDGNEMYITRNTADSYKIFKKNDKVVKLKIFYSKKINDNWTEPKPFVYNIENYNCAHPFLSPDGKRLYFSSDKPGGVGGLDLYVCYKDSIGWSEPKNMGNKINTSGNELFPYIHDDGTFLFSSNGRDGLGGLDLYWCKINADVLQSDPKNMGAPVNSSEDDFGVIFNNATHYGYFSTNRELRNANDDIYSFKRLLKVEGIVLQKGTEIPVADATVYLKNNNSADLETRSKEDGTFEFPIECGIDYVVEATKAGWSVDKTNFSTANIFPTENIKVKLEIDKKPLIKPFQLIVKVIDKVTRKPIEEANIGVDQTEITLGYTNEKGIWQQDLKPNTKLNLVITKTGYNMKVIYMSNEGQSKEKDYEIIVELTKGEDIGPYARWYKIIYFDFDKSNVRQPDANITMKEVSDFLREHPDARLLMNSYCDSRGTTEYNMKLSRRRAEGATNWLVKDGIERKMVEKMEWGGESMLISKCADGSKCSEFEHQLNRRTEIRVIRVEKEISMQK